MPNLQEVYGITNNHVAANLNNCNVGDEINREDTGQPAGSLSHWVPLRTHSDNEKINEIDMALIKMHPGDALQWRMKDPNRTRPLGYLEPRQNGLVYMSDAAGLFREGRITKTFTNHIMQFFLCGKPFLFSRLIEIRPVTDRTFSVAGNSGSVIMTSNHYIVGLLVGANSDGTRSYAVPFVEGILNYAPLSIL